ncbi:hypothetical protein BM526_07290 [Alteromonas mediterranea]|uniref:glycosyltransferase family 39 protein n=1 Tax=Alteromonas mediterranea TaxID=314275 RepID=UPI0009034F9B|nr:glycosyltransferase family 39 protein [Alteromonas mediterranea]APE01663.1 hypothetical protein BM526_07290 [Alteromonas mediterranea]
MQTLFEKIDEKSLVLFLLALTFIVRLLGADSFSLWFDEALNFRIVSNPWNVLWISNYDPTPPLYYSILKVFISPNTSELTIRLPSIIFGTLTVFIFYKICRLFFTKIDSFLATILFSLSVHQVEYSQEARAYATQLFFAITALYYLLTIVLKSPMSKKAYCFYGVFTLCALYTHNISVFYVVSYNMIFFIHLVKDQEYKKVKPWVITNSIVFALWLPWPLVTVLSGEGNTFNWLKHISFGQFILSSAKSIKISADPDSVKAWDIIFIAAMMYGLWHCVRTKQRNLVPVLFSMAFALLLCVWTVGFYKPIFMSRTIVGSTLIAYLLIACFVSSLNNKIKFISFSMLCAFHIIAYMNFYSERYSENEQWKQAVAKLEFIGAENILICTESPSWVLSYYNTPSFNFYSYDKSVNGIYEVEKSLVNKINDSNKKKVNASDKNFLDNAENFFFIDSHCSKDTREQFNSMFELSVVDVESYRRVKIYSAKFI